MWKIPPFTLQTFIYNARNLKLIRTCIKRVFSSLQTWTPFHYTLLETISFYVYWELWLWQQNCNRKKERFLKFLKIKCVSFLTLYKLKWKEGPWTLWKKRKKKHSKLAIERNRFQKMHATQNKKTRNPRGCNHIKCCYINMSF
jgi:hypothetical protein